VAERMADYFVGHHATMPGRGKPAQAVDAARCLEHGAHASMMTSVPAPRQDSRGGFHRIIPMRLRGIYWKAGSGEHGPGLDEVKFP